MKIRLTILFLFVYSICWGQLSFNKLNRDFLWDAFADGDTLFNKMVVITVKTGQFTANDRKAVAYFPDDYTTDPTKRFPLIIWNHGSGEGGPDAEPANLDDGDGIPEEFSSGRYTDMKFTSPLNGQVYDFIVICPQNRTTGSPFTGGQLYYMWNNDPAVKARIDTNNIYLAGLSLGGQAACRNLAETEASLYLRYYRGLFFMSAPRVSGYGDVWDYTTARVLKTPVREYMGTQEVQGRIDFAREIRDSLNIVNPNQVYLHEYNAGHSGWQAFLQRTHRINGMNYGEWFLSLMVTNGKPPMKTITTKKAGQRIDWQISNP